MKRRTEVIALCVLELFLELTCKARMMQRRYALLTCRSIDDNGSRCLIDNQWRRTLRQTTVC